LSIPINRQTDRQTDRQRDRQTVRQTEQTKQTVTGENITSLAEITSSTILFPDNRQIYPPLSE